MNIKPKESTKRIIKITYCILMAVALIAAIVSVRDTHNKIAGTIFYSIVMFVWILRTCFPRMIFETRKAFFKKYKNKEIQKYEIMMDRILAVFWLVFSVYQIKRIWKYL
ncbi:hypothetical protein QBE52_04395 [Clostridiaceae bacterium 35-E11]